MTSDKVYFYTPVEYCNKRGIPIKEELISAMHRAATARVRITLEPTSKRQGSSVQRRLVSAYTLATLDAVYEGLKK